MPMKVFLSSTFIDLVQHREKAAEVISRLGQHGARMEVFGARPNEPMEASLEEVDACDLFIGIYAHRYGYVKPGSEMSITEAEYHRAREGSKPMFCFLLDEDHAWPPKMIEDEPGKSKLKAFKQAISREVVRETFTTPDDLGLKIGTSVGRYLAVPPAREFDQVAAVCYQKEGNSTKLLLVKTTGGRWTFPKGRVGVDESPSHAAAREAYEEAGASGEVETTPFAVYLHLKQEWKMKGQEVKVAAFLLHVQSTQEPQEERREPTWFSWTEAERTLADGRQFKYAEEFRRVLRQARSLIA